MDLIRSLNRFMDELPRPRLGHLGREVPAFRACGITGLYLGLIALFAGGLLAGRSLPVLAILAIISIFSFYAYTYLRKWLSGGESLVLLEHVWFALACNALALRLLSEPVWPYLDVVSVALCPFLAAGRVGCTLVGCCHGRPSSFGITYGESCVLDGFSPYLAGVRLFPAPAIEALGLLVIGAVGLIALPFAKPGHVLIWFLLAYAVMRFGLEGIRADRRPHFLGLSQARWMAILEAGFALFLAGGNYRSLVVIIYAGLLAVLIVTLALAWYWNWRRRLIMPFHVRELRELADAEMKGRLSDSLAPPSLHRTSQQVVVAVSAAEAAWPNAAHISLSLPEPRSDLPLLCELAARAFPEMIYEAARFTSNRVLHFPVGQAGLHPDQTPVDHLAQRLYGRLAHRGQRAADDGGYAPPWYFADATRRKAGER
jgi:prolipoprotein diacylglyceryltransferase